MIDNHRHVIVTRVETEVGTCIFTKGSVGFIMKYSVVLFFSLLAFCLQAQASVEMFARLPFVKDVQISPNGKKIAYLRDMDGKYVVVSQILGDTNAKPNVFGMKEAKIRSFTWANDERIILKLTMPYNSKADFEVFTMHRMGILNVPDNKIIWSFKGPKFDYNIGAPKLVNKLAGDNEHVLMSYYYTGAATNLKAGDLYHAVYKVNLANGDREKLYSSKSGDNWTTNTRGDIIVEREFNVHEDKTLNMFRHIPTASFKPLTQVKDGKTVFFTHQIAGVNNTANEIYYFGRNEREISQMYQANVKNHVVSDSKLLGAFDQFDADYSIEDYHNSQIVGVSYIGDYPEYTYFDLDLAQVQADLKATFPDAEIKITSYSKARNRIIVKISGAKSPDQYVLYDRQAGQLQTIADAYPGVSQFELGTVNSYVYQTSDDKTIYSYLTEPAKKENQKLPLIVLPHGGPEGRDHMGFDWIRQFYVAQGYAVFQPNFRGSSGYGADFIKSGYGEWGKKMQRDVNEGVEKLIAEGKVDPDRVCIVGASYGGYVALYSATTHQSLYKCSVSFAGISNLGDIFLHAKEQKNSVSYWKRVLGTSDYDELHKYSPYHLASNKTIPTLLIHGDEDTEVPSFQSKKMFKRLEELGASGSKYIEVKGADHWFSTTESRRVFLAESLKFIKTYI